MNSFKSSDSFRVLFRLFIAFLFFLLLASLECFNILLAISPVTIVITHALFHGVKLLRITDRYRMTDIFHSIYFFRRVCPTFEHPCPCIFLSTSSSFSGSVFSVLVTWDIPPSLSIQSRATRERIDTDRSSHTIMINIRYCLQHCYRYIFGVTTPHCTTITIHCTCFLLLFPFSFFVLFI